jgi:hypothetical protein
MGESGPDTGTPHQAIRIARPSPDRFARGSRSIAVATRGPSHGLRPVRRSLRVVLADRASAHLLDLSVFVGIH